MSIPTITIGTPSRTKISHVSGYDQATVTFQSDMSLNNWEARATLQGVTPAHGVGLLVESGGTLAANTNATVYVNDEELTNGDREYTITVFGHGSNGYWSDGTYEGINLIDLSNITEIYNGTIMNGIVTFSTNAPSTTRSSVLFDLYNGSMFIETPIEIETVGTYTAELHKDSSFDSFDILFYCESGDYAYITMNADMMEDGNNYIFAMTADSLSYNTAVIRNISLVKVVV